MLDDLYRPLGRDLPPRRGGRVSAKRVLGVLAVLFVVGGSAATAWMQPKLRVTDAFVEAAKAEAERMALLAKAEVTAAPLAPLRSGPRILSGPRTPDPSLPTIIYPPGEGGGAGKMIEVTDPASWRQPASMAAAPDDGLIEESDAGPLPIRGEDGRRPFDVYSVTPESDVGTRVAIVVGGLGISQTGTQAAIRSLPAGVTLAFAPAGNSLGRWMQEARRSRHELLLQLPMEPFGYPNVTPGPNTITADAAASGDFGALDQSLGRLTNYAGVTNYMGARLTADEAALSPLLAELSRRGLMYLDDGSSARSLAKDGARSAGTVFARADILLDGTQSPDAIAKQLETLERIARADGTAIATASAFDTSVSAIAKWIAEAETRGIRVVPVSALADDPESR